MSDQDNAPEHTSSQQPERRDLARNPGSAKPATHEKHTGKLSPGQKHQQHPGDKS